MSTDSADTEFPGFSSQAIGRRPTGVVELLLPTALAEALRAEQLARTEALEAAYRASEEMRRSSAAPAPASPAPPAAAHGVPNREMFIAYYERDVSRRNPRRRHPVLRGEELFRVMTRISTLRDKDNQKREMELLKKLEAVGPLRDVVNPMLRRVQWERALQQLREAHPHFSKVTEFVARNIALASHSRQPLRLAPMHLWGSPGIGKTLYANDLAQALGAPLRRHSMENAQTTSLLLGTERHWSTACQGLVFEAVCLGQVANPVFLIDELDKAPREAQYDPLAPLHSLLEPLTARRVRDASLDIEFDASLVTFVATSNDPGKVPETLRGRFREFHILPPTGAQAMQVAQVVAAAAVQQLGVPGFAPPPAPLCRHLAHLTAREIFQVVQDAVSRALAAERRHLTLADLPEEIEDEGSRQSILH